MDKEIVLCVCLCVCVCVCVYNGMLFSHKKGNLVICENMDGIDLEGIMLSEISQTEKDKYLMISLCVGSKK